MSSPVITTHYDFGSMHDVLVKLDVLGHDDPTMIRMLMDLTGVDAQTISLTDPKVISLFSGKSSKNADWDEQQYPCKPMAKMLLYEPMV